MAQHGVNPEGIPFEAIFDRAIVVDLIKGSLRYYKVKGFGSFSCSSTSCFRRWPSAHAWCVIDLKKQDIVHKYGQGCQGCENFSKPAFDDIAIERMAEYAVERYLSKVDKKKKRPFVMDELLEALPEVRDESAPHDEKRCEACKELGGSCWKR